MESLRESSQGGGRLRREWGQGSGSSPGLRRVEVRLRRVGAAVSALLHLWRRSHLLCSLDSDSHFSCTNHTFFYYTSFLHGLKSF